MKCFCSNNKTMAKECDEPLNILSDAEKLSIRVHNEQNMWSISKQELLQLICQHQVARKCNDRKEMLKIEYRLEDCNFHYEVGMLIAGKYDELRKELK